MPKLAAFFKPRPILCIGYPAHVLAETPVEHNPVSEAARTLAAARKSARAKRAAVHAGLRQAVAQ